MEAVVAIVCTGPAWMCKEFLSLMLRLLILAVVTCPVMGIAVSMQQQQQVHDSARQ